MSSCQFRTLALAAITVLLACAGTAQVLRPPAVPLVANDPYFSVWSAGDKLTDVDTTHWTGKPHRLASMIRIDDKPFRVMGAEPSEVPPMEQTGLQVLPTRTIYTFEAAGVALTLTFMTPALPDDLEVLSWPVTYVTYSLRSTDGKHHEVDQHVEVLGELAVNMPDETVVVDAPSTEGLLTLRMGSETQPVLQKNGDDIRIDWGYLYVSAPTDLMARGGFRSPHREFANVGRLATTDGQNAIPGNEVSANLHFPAGTVGPEPVSRWFMLAYDDLYSIQYMRENLRPYWRRNGWEAEDLLNAAADRYEELKARCEAFDAELMADMTRIGGAQYADICALAFRQCFAAGKFVADANGQPLQFCKENHSNGCIATSDVFYPMAPQFLLFGPTLTKSFLVPFMNYAASERWKFPFAPHDLGQYPHANGQVYGGGETSEERQMPVEECGNLLLLFGALAKMEENADFAGLYWPQLSQWAEYLKEKGYDPENQLCTDDFAGHMAHNVNLSAKAICALGAYSQLCALRGETARASEFQALAKNFAAMWMAEADDGRHFRLAFDKPGTWSQKYNLVWDRILGLGLFPSSVAEKEMAHYRRIQNQYGLPLDNRDTYTKLDWILWTATLTQDRDDFEALVAPVHRFLNETPDRRPMTDWYFTDTAKRRGFTARPVVGGVFLQALYDDALWRKYAAREKAKASGWAPMPQPPRVEVLVPTSQEQPAQWRYATTKPKGDWWTADYDDSAWAQGPGGFGTRGTPGAVVRTGWSNEHIWIRRSFVLDAVPERPALLMHHDEDATVFINGQRALTRRGYRTGYEWDEIDPGVLRVGENVILIYCTQSTGGQYIDAGIVALRRSDDR